MRRRNMLRAALLALALLTSPLHAQERDPDAPTCTRTPSLSGVIVPAPEFISPHNNLRRKVGGGHFAEGTPLHVRGRVVDEHCTPIVHARVVWWQANTHGRYQHRQNGTQPIDPHFNGAGTVLTDNDGRFEFMTVYPGKYSGSAPHAHIRVAHPKHQPLLSSVYFDGDRHNANAADLRKLSRNIRDRITYPTHAYGAGKTVTVDITMRGNTPYRSY